MANTANEPKAKQHPEMQNLTGEEQKSVTHGEFWIPEAERQVYQRVLRKLNEDGVKYVVSGLYALYEYTGIYRKTKDLDLFVEPAHVVTAARSLKEAGFNVYLEQEERLALCQVDGGAAVFGDALDFLDDQLKQRLQVMLRGQVGRNTHQAAQLARRLLDTFGLLGTFRRLGS